MLIIDMLKEYVVLSKLTEKFHVVEINQKRYAIFKGLVIPNHVAVCIGLQILYKNKSLYRKLEINAELIKEIRELNEIFNNKSITSMDIITSINNALAESMKDWESLDFELLFDIISE